MNASIAASVSRSVSGANAMPDTEPGLEKRLELNSEYAANRPNISEKKDPAADAKEFDGVLDKLEELFSPNPMK